MSAISEMLCFYSVKERRASIQIEEIEKSGVRERRGAQRANLPLQSQAEAIDTSLDMRALSLDPRQVGILDPGTGEIVDTGVVDIEQTAVPHQRLDHGLREPFHQGQIILELFQVTEREARAVENHPLLVHAGGRQVCIAAFRYPAIHLSDLMLVL